MENKTITLKSFLDQNKIIYKAMWYFLRQGGDEKKKKPIGEMNNLSVEALKNERKVHGNKPTYYFEKGKGKILLTPPEFDSLQMAHSLYLKHTDDVFCVDIDEPQIKSLNDLIQYNNKFNIFNHTFIIHSNKITR